MDVKQWAQLRKKLFENLTTILGSLLEEDWNKDTSRKANKLLSQKMPEYAAEFGFPPLPAGNVYFAHLSFKPNKSISDGPLEPHLSLYYKLKPEYSRNHLASKPTAMRGSPPAGVPIHKAPDSTQ